MDAADWLKSESEVGNCNSITQAAHLWSAQTFAKVATATSDECCLCNCHRCCRRAEFTVCLSNCRSCHEGRHWMFWCCRSTYCVVILQLVNKLLLINDRDCADCIIVLANPNTWPWLMTLTASPQRAVVMTHIQNQARMSVGSKINSENRWTDKTDCITVSINAVGNNPYASGVHICWCCVEFNDDVERQQVSSSVVLDAAGSLSNANFCSLTTVFVWHELLKLLNCDTTVVHNAIWNAVLALFVKSLCFVWDYVPFSILKTMITGL